MKHEMDTSTLLASALVLVVLLAGAFYVVDMRAEQRGRIDSERKHQIERHLEEATGLDTRAADAKDTADELAKVNKEFDQDLKTNRNLLMDTRRRADRDRPAHIVVKQFHALGYQSARLRYVHDDCPPVERP